MSNSPLHFGRIAWAEIADSNGIRMMRPVVIVSPDDSITPTGRLAVVAITSRLAKPLPRIMCCCLGIPKARFARGSIVSALRFAVG